MDTARSGGLFLACKVGEAAIRTVREYSTPIEDANMNENNRIQYPLKAWIEGNYARDCSEPREKCPYRHGSPMALAWLRGWRHREQVDAAKNPETKASD